MRGRRQAQSTMLAFVDLEERVPRNHPLERGERRRPYPPTLQLLSEPWSLTTRIGRP
jgi:hypothetical protein